MLAAVVNVSIVSLRTEERDAFLETIVLSLLYVVQLFSAGVAVSSTYSILLLFLVLLFCFVFFTSWKNVLCKYSEQ